MSGDHLIARFRGDAPGPTVVVVGSLHGNEPAGERAARRVAAEIERGNFRIRGEVLLLAGNTRALARGVRYIDADLNRHWEPWRIEAIHAGVNEAMHVSESLEVRELLAHLDRAFAEARGTVYVLDLHTMSADGTPFVTLGDTLRNRAFAFQIPAPIILGLEEQLDGTMLEYVNDLGAITLGFEAGQHSREESVENHEALIWLALVASGALDAEEVPDLAERRRAFEAATGGRKIIEVRYRHAIRSEDQFRMEPGFRNFEPVVRGQTLAHDARGPVIAGETGLVLMPLYQALGDDGYFLSREVRPIWLTLSKWLRRCRVGHAIHVLPGVRRDPTDAQSFVIDTRIARFFPLQIFHLLGFRKRRWEGDVLLVSRRRFDAV